MSGSRTAAPWIGSRIDVMQGMFGGMASMTEGTFGPFLEGRVAHHAPDTRSATLGS
jgi:hypothetical protein